MPSSLVKMVLIRDKAPENMSDISFDSELQAHIKLQLLLTK